MDVSDLVHQDDDNLNRDVIERDDIEENEMEFQLDPEFDISTGHLIKVFNQLDKNKRGYLTYDELLDGLQGLWKGQAEFSRPRFLKLLNEIDLDHSHDISQVEFVYYLQEWAARSTVSTKKLLEAFCYEYSASKAACRFITVDGGKDTISLKQFLLEPATPADKNTVRWVHVAGKDASVILRLASKFHLSQLEIEDILNEHEHPKVNIHPDRLHVLVSEVLLRQAPEGIRVKFYDFSLFLINENVVLSVAKKKTDITKTLMTRITSAGSKLRLNGAKFLLYSVLDTLVDHVFLVVRTLEAKLEIHQKAIHKMISIEAIKSLGALQKELDRMEQWFSPMMVVISRLQNVLVVEDDNLRRYLIDLQEHVITQRDTVTSLGKWARSLNQIYVNEQQYHINQAVYILTVITSVFIPAQFLTGVYGMNFDNMPELHWKYSYLVFWIVVILLTFMVCFSFWKKGWFKF